MFPEDNFVSEFWGFPGPGILWAVLGGPPADAGSVPAGRPLRYDLAAGLREPLGPPPCGGRAHHRFQSALLECGEYLVPDPVQQGEPHTARTAMAQELERAGSALPPLIFCRPPPMVSTPGR